MFVYLFKGSSVVCVFCFDMTEIVRSGLKPLGTLDYMVPEGAAQLLGRFLDRLRILFSPRPTVCTKTTVTT